jgi:cytochrome c biogenesis protein CcmG, thiol:disulfide interchange protein DsbE
MKKTIVAIGFLLMFAITLKAQTCSDFTLPDVSGNDVTLNTYLDKGPVLISFWASWCSPCKDEMRKMQGIYEKYKDKGFTYIAINQDNQKSIAKVKAFVEAENFTFPVILDSDQKINEAYNGANLGLPYALLIGKSKEIISKHTGYLPGDEVTIENEIKTALGIKE